MVFSQQHPSRPSLHLKIFLFLSIKAEVDTSSFISALFNSPFRVILSLNFTHISLAAVVSPLHYFGVPTSASYVTLGKLNSQAQFLKMGINM